MAKGVAEIAMGPMFIGVVFNLVLYGIMITQVHLYFATFPKDRKWFKCLVLFLFIADTVNIVFDLVYVYQSLVIHFGDSPYLSTANWVFATDPAMTGIIASSVQLFFAWRIFIITKSKFATAAVVVGAFVGVFGSIGTSIAVEIVPEFTEFVKFKSIVIIWLVSSVATDVCIAFVLSHYLQTHKTSFSKTNDMVNRIIRLTVQTGAITAIWATVDLIVYLVDNTGTHLIFNVPLSKLYSNSLMSSLNSRKGWNFGESQGDSTSIASGVLTRGMASNAVGLTSTNGRQEILVRVERHEMSDVGDIPGFSFADAVKVEEQSSTSAIPNSNEVLPESDASSSDPASSLRAAALLTLKSKRRKPAYMTAPPPRPVPSGITLNYGDDEPSPGTTAATFAVDKSMKASEVGDNREEGEISDTESPSPVSLSVAKTPQSIGTYNTKMISDASATTTQPPTRPPTIPVQRVASGPTTPVNRISPPPVAQSITASGFHPPVGINHARPGLAMPQDDYDRSKDIILDLLGWGMDPEYLAQTGISREVIFYVFTELRLRLPNNLDITGLTPYYPPANTEAVQLAPAPHTRQLRADSSAMAMPPPSIPPRHDAPRTIHPSLPQKPPSRPPTELEIVINVHPSDQERKHDPAEANLHEIEQQRKQELIARKAAQASRKIKAPFADAPAPPLSTNEDVHMVNNIQNESVDDFLKSIGPMTEFNGRSSFSLDDARPGRHHESPEAMEVDEIPGFSDFSTPSNIESPPRSASTAGPSDVDIHRLSTDNLSVGSLQDQDHARRGTKRPVASDFVDFEPGPQRSTNGHANGGAQPPSMRRKKTGSFASVSGMRRCVIDLSDSDDDGDVDDSYGESARGSRQYSPIPTRPTSSVGNGARSQAQQRANGNRGQSPAELYAKEEEIKKMKELIALREQSRLKKLAVRLQQSKPAPLSTKSVASALPIKAEEPDTPTVPSLNATPPPISNGTAPAPLALSNGTPRRQGSGSILSSSEIALASANGLRVASASATPPIGSLSQSLAQSSAD
ncbi:hypothetical protein HWV62_3815 [Athelia sp. TMB]|nr:hypothetical protein HWV62_3815 [Athelia sp. TMB]